MVTCPWCGTTYATFQSNCSRCGGPILPLSVIETSEDAPLVPPPAPRPISDTYILKLMGSEGWSIAGLVFALLGGIFSVVGFGLTLGIITAFVGLPILFLGLIFLASGAGLLIWRYQVNQKQVQVLKYGEPNLGLVNNLQENFSIQINGRHPWAIGYQYQANGQTLEGQVTTLNQPGPQLQPGKEVYVLFMRNDPTVSSLYPHP